MRQVAQPTPQQAATVNPNAVAAVGPTPQMPQGLEGGQPSPGMRPVSTPPQPVESGNRVPIVGAGLDMLAAGRRALTGGGQKLDQIFARGAPFEKDDIELHTLHAQIQQFLNNANRNQDPKIIQNFIDDYHTRVDRLEKLRGTQ